MAKKKNNKKRDGAISMEFSKDTNLPEAMDTSEATVSKPVLGVGNRCMLSGGPGCSCAICFRKMKKAGAMKRSKNLRKMKAIEKAISKSEQSEEKISKSKIKVQRIQSAKSLYD